MGTKDIIAAIKGVEHLIKETQKFIDDTPHFKIRIMQGPPGLSDGEIRDAGELVSESHPMSPILDDLHVIRKRMMIFYGEEMWESSRDMLEGIKNGREGYQA